jgi:hypothetical protein
MKVLIPTILFFGMCVLLFSCKSNAKVTSLDSYTKNMIAFSTGGGFTGVETIFTVLENGQVFSASGLDPKKTVAFGSLPTKTTKSFFEKVNQINWAKNPINDPGNLYHTLSFGTNGNMKKQVWGGGKETPSKEITDLYYELSNTINALKK